MRPIHKFILHVVHNWKNELNEAYSEGAVKKFIEKFREEADDLNIQITDEQLKAYIQRFDVLKNSPKIQEKDLNKYSLSALIKLVTASKGAESEDEDKTPDVVYQDNGITIWNGSKEGNYKAGKLVHGYPAWYFFRLLRSRGSRSPRSRSSLCGRTGPVGGGGDQASKGP